MLPEDCAQKAKELLSRPEGGPSRVLILRDFRVESNPRRIEALLRDHFELCVGVYDSRCGADDMVEDMQP